MSEIDKQVKPTFLRSLRFRIMMILVIIGIVPCLLATNVVIGRYRSRAIQLRTMNVRNQGDILCNLLMSEDYLSNLDSKVINGDLTLISNIYNGRVMIVDGDYRVVRDTYDLDTGKTSVSKEIISALSGGSGETQYDSVNDYILMTFPLHREGSSEISGVMLISVSTTEIEQMAGILENWGMLVTGVVTLIVLVAGYFLAGLLVRPFLTVTSAIEDVTDGYVDDAISVPDYSETVQIIDAFNRMLGRIRTMDQSRQEFVSNVSHELKTPLASMKVLADSLNSMEDVPIEYYREFMQDITGEIDRENKIISDLLSMVRMDRKAASMKLEECDIGGMLEVIVKRLRPIAAERGIEINLSAPQTVRANVDDGKLSLAFSNLIENAVKYNRDKGWVRVTLSTDRKYFYVYVEDGGQGIPADQIEHIFERFYRGDKSHSTTIEGTGLGLAIARQAILLHHGVIKVSSREGEGTTFQVRIPFISSEG